MSGRCPRCGSPTGYELSPTFEGEFCPHRACGWREGEHARACPRCGGSGHVEDGTTAGRRCPLCRGTGQVPG